MGISSLISQYGLPVDLIILLAVGLVALFLAVAVALLAMLVRMGEASSFWRAVASHPVLGAAVVISLILAAGVAAYFHEVIAEENFRLHEKSDLLSRSNLIDDPLFTSAGPAASMLASWTTDGPTPSPMWQAIDSAMVIPVQAQHSITSSVITVQSKGTYHYSIYAGGSDSGGTPGTAQVRMLWLDRALNVVSWNDSPSWKFYPDSLEEFFTGAYQAPDGAKALRFVIRNVDASGIIHVHSPKVSQDGVYVEQYPNGAQGALAFSFDWESAMGGAIHSKGMDIHDPAGAAAHGMEMRQGADWLANLFAQYGIKATFYATGYNLLDGNTERRTFSGDPVYRWASRKNGWASDWWVTHKWYADDPFGSIQSDPAWYFGDQTRALLKAGHEVASHTFGHLYVRGTTPQELATDLDEWLAAAKSVGVPPPTTLAFPWRSSNSLTPDFYKVLYDRGIQAVTRLYPLDMRDLYTVGAVGVYPDIAVMPDFLLGSASANSGEEAAGNPIGADEGLQVITQTIQRRGTTSFWQHPEQLAPAPELDKVRAAWQSVVAVAANERDKGRIWIGTVAEITAYERDIRSLTTRLDSGWRGWKVQVSNPSSKSIAGVTLTMPGDIVRASSSQAEVRTVYNPDVNTTLVSDAGQPKYPARQIVLTELKPGTTTIDIQFASGQEPPR